MYKFELRLGSTSFVVGVFKDVDTLLEEVGSNVRDLNGLSAKNKSILIYRALQWTKVLPHVKEKIICFETSIKNHRANLNVGYKLTQL